MENTNPINIQDLQERAEESEHKESYQPLEKKRGYRIGAGVRVTPSGASFFLEVLVNLCPSSSTPNLTLVERNLTLLKELQARGYTLNCQDDNCISCETTLPPQNLTKEYETIRAITTNTLLIDAKDVRMIDGD